MSEFTIYHRLGHSSGDARWPDDYKLVALVTAEDPLMAAQQADESWHSSGETKRAVVTFGEGGRNIEGTREVRRSIAGDILIDEAGQGFQLRKEAEGVLHLLFVNALEADSGSEAEQKKLESTWENLRDVGEAFIDPLGQLTRVQDFTVFRARDGAEHVFDEATTVKAHGMEHAACQALIGDANGPRAQVGDLLISEQGKAYVLKSAALLELSEPREYREVSLPQVHEFLRTLESDLGRGISR